MFDKLLILGVGLMGGSLGLAIKQAGVAACVSGWSRRESTLQKALELGAIDRYDTELNAALKDADCVVIATPTQLTESIIVDVVKKVGSETLVTDVASVKGNLARALIAGQGSVPANVVLGHPICGSEKSGVNAAQADLYQGQKVVLIEDDFTAGENLERIRLMWEALGADVHLMTLAQHDTTLALTSHLPHMLAFALMNQLDSATSGYDIFQLSGGGFRDFSRIAASDPLMWREIALANSEHLVSAIDGFDAELQALKQAVANGDGEKLQEIFSRAQKLRQSKVK